MFPVQPPSIHPAWCTGGCGCTLAELGFRAYYWNSWHCLSQWDGQLCCLKWTLKKMSMILIIHHHVYYANQATYYVTSRGPTKGVQTFVGKPDPKLQIMVMLAYVTTDIKLMDYKLLFPARCQCFVLQT